MQDANSKQSQIALLKNYGVSIPSCYSVAQFRDLACETYNGKNANLEEDHQRCAFLESAHYCPIQLPLCLAIKINFNLINGLCTSLFGFQRLTNTGRHGHQNRSLLVCQAFTFYSKIRSTTGFAVFRQQV
ncbi:uncharacterized protein LOC130700199 [Daphnia carinata]|uniref:uncharacterized protein LOC130700199 n=1 Tax=Daphnia carinata TaxID=120202 RepID=UPI002868A7E8|nr:uncharacterized protein LOC130700199 [Daphnia carinata]